MTQISVGNQLAQEGLKEDSPLLKLAGFAHAGSTQNGVGQCG